MTIKVLKEEVDRSIKIFLEAAHWGKANGKNLWSDEDLDKHNLLKYYKKDEFYLVQVDGEDAGSMVIQWEDTLFWPEFELNDAGYLHKLCIKRKFASSGLSDQMIQLAVKICKAKGVGKLRLDTGWGNTKLCSLYERNGFNLFDRFWLNDDCDFARYQLDLDL